MRKTEIKKEKDMNYVELGKTGLRISYLGLGGIPVQKCSEDEV